MAKKELIEYVDEYLENGYIHGESTLNGDYKKGNKAYEKIDKIFNIAKKSDEKERFYLTTLEKSKDANTLTWCCVNMLKLNIHTKVAKEKLNEIAKSNNIHPVFKLMHY